MRAGGSLALWEIITELLLEVQDAKKHGRDIVREGKLREQISAAAVLKGLGVTEMIFKCFMAA